jgi:sec-independent protein translocase protein TatC
VPRKKDSKDITEAPSRGKKAPAAKSSKRGKKRDPEKGSALARLASQVPEKVEEQEEEIDPAALERGDTPMSLVSHLDEFRSRIVFVLITILVLLLASFVFSDEILSFLTAPYTQTGLKLNVFNLIDGFVIRLKASLVIALLAGFPVIVYEIWKYIVPAISTPERAFARGMVIVSIGLFYTGVGLTYLGLPMAISALLSFTPPDVVNMISASDYLSLIMIFSFAMGGIFELPIIILILTKIGLVTPAFLVSKRKYAIVLIWVIAAIITPTVDPLTQSMVAIPLMLLYEISIIISKSVVKAKARREKEQGY